MYSDIKHHKRGSEVLGRCPEQQGGCQCSITGRLYDIPSNGGRVGRGGGGRKPHRNPRGVKLAVLGCHSQETHVPVILEGLPDHSLYSSRVTSFFTVEERVPFRPQCLLISPNPTHQKHFGLVPRSWLSTPGAAPGELARKLMG